MDSFTKLITVALVIILYLLLAGGLLVFIAQVKILHETVKTTLGGNMVFAFIIYFLVVIALGFVSTILTLSW